MKKVVVWGGILAVVLVAAWFATHTKDTRSAAPLETDETADDVAKPLQPSHIALSKISEKEGAPLETESAPADAPVTSSPESDAASNDAVVEEETKVDATAHDDEADTSAKLQDALAKDAAVQKVATIQSVTCEAQKCLVAAEPKPDQERTFQMTVMRFFSLHPEFGAHFTVVNDPNNAKVAIFTFSKATKVQ